MNRHLPFLKKVTVLFSVSLLLCFTGIKAQTLNPGDLTVVGWNALTNEVRIVTLVDIPAGTVIKITDRGWDGSANAFTILNPSNTGDGIVTWTLSSEVPAGTVLELFLGGADDGTSLNNLTAPADFTSDMTITGYLSNDAITNVGDQIFIYQGADTNPFFIFGLNSSSGTVYAANWNTSISATLRDSQLPNASGSQNALTNGVNAIGLWGGTNQQDNVQYTGPISTADRDTWLARITDISNWNGSNDPTSPVNPITSALPPIVDIGAPNAPPTITGLPTVITIIEDVMGNLNIASSNFADEDSDELTVTLSVSNGTIAFSATNISVTFGGNGTATATITGTLSDINSYINVPSNIQYIPPANLSGPAADILTIVANDGDGSGDVELGTVPIDITTVNDAPIAVDDEVTVTEDIPATGNVLTNDSDPEGNALTASLVTAPVNGTVVLNADGSFTYTPIANYNGPDSLIYQVCDNGTPSFCDTAKVLFTVEAINNPPTITTSGGTTTFTESVSGSPVPVLIDDALTISDPDNTTLASATAAITGNFQSGQDVLAFVNDGSTMGNIDGSYSTGTLTLTSPGATATLAQWQAALRAVTYSNTSSTPNTANRTISFVVNDGLDDSTPGTKTVAIQTVNNAPVITNLDGDAVTFTEDGPAILLDAGGNATVSDSDSPDLDGGNLTVSVIAGGVGSEDMLAIRNEDGTDRCFK